MAKPVEFFFDVVSPTAYLAWTQMPALATRSGAEIVWRPFFLGGVMQATGNRPPGMVAPKGKWMNEDLQRFARRYGVPFAFNPAFPMNTLPAMRGALHAEREGMLQPYLDQLFPAAWVEARDVGAADVLGDIVAKAGLDPARFEAAIQSDEIKSALKANTDEAVERGAFGAPTFFVGNEMFFGQDRLDFVEEAVGA